MWFLELLLVRILLVQILSKQSLMQTYLSRVFVFILVFPIREQGKHSREQERAKQECGLRWSLDSAWSTSIAPQGVLPCNVGGQSFVISCQSLLWVFLRRKNGKTTFCGKGLLLAKDNVSKKGDWRTVNIPGLGDGCLWVRHSLSLSVPSTWQNLFLCIFSFATIILKKIHTSI